MNRYSGVSALVLAVAVATTQSPTTYAQAAAATAATGADDSLEEIIVSATRIQSPGFTAPTPITVMTSQEFEQRAAVTLSDVLYDLPSVNNGTSAIGVSNAGQTTLNLRGLNGQNTRSLLLVDGQRMTATDQYGHTDLGIIPTLLIQRTDVVTGGASAAWGTDALAGVVNVVLKNKLDGLQGNVQYGQSQLHDNKQLQGSLGWGTPFAGGRGQFMVAAEYSNLFDPPIYGSREWGDKRTAFTTQTINGVTYSNVPTNGLSLYQLTNGGVISASSASVTAAPRGLTPASPLYGLQFGANGAPGAYVFTTNPAIRGGTSYGVGGDGAWVADQNYFGEKIRRYNLFTKSTYDVTDKIRASFIANYADLDIRATQPPISEPGGTSNGQPFTVSQANPYLQALTTPLPGSTLSLYQTMVANGIQTIAINRLAPELGRFSTESDTSLYHVAAQLDGVFGDTGKWTAYLSTGQSSQHVSMYNNIIESNLRAALEPIVVNGQIVCDPTVVAAYNAASGCVPLNPFGANSITSAAAGYVEGTLTNHITNGLTAGGASMNAQPFSDWAGPVAVAAGVDWRQESLESITNSNDPPTGLNGRPYFHFLPGIAVGGTFDNANPKTILHHSENIAEAFAEVGLPVLKDVWGAKSLDLNGAYRFAKNSISGNTNSTKYGLTWQPMEGLLIRAAQSQDTRVPNLTELYSGANIQTGFTSTAAVGTTAATDPQVPGVYAFPIVAGGNPGLSPEVSRSTTFGATINPTWFPALSLSVDSWLIHISNEISQPGAPAIINGCYAQGGFVGAPQPAFCSLISRIGGAGTPISVVYNNYANVAFANQRGIDYELAYRTPLSSLIHGAPGTLEFRALATDLLTYTQQSFAVSPQVESSGTGNFPHLRLTFNTNYHLNDFDFGIINKYVSKQAYTLNNAPSATGAVPYYSNRIDSVWFTNAHFAYNFKSSHFSKLQAYFNISNLFNQAPPQIIANGPPPGAAPTTANATGDYDVIGRAFTAGIRFQQ